VGLDKLRSLRTAAGCLAARRRLSRSQAEVCSAVQLRRNLNKAEDFLVARLHRKVEEVSAARPVKEVVSLATLSLNPNSNNPVDSLDQQECLLRNLQEAAACSRTQDRAPSNRSSQIAFSATLRAPVCLAAIRAARSLSAAARSSIANNSRQLPIQFSV